MIMPIMMSIIMRMLRRHFLRRRIRGGFRPSQKPHHLIFNAVMLAHVRRLSQRGGRVHFRAADAAHFEHHHLEGVFGNKPLANFKSLDHIFEVCRYHYCITRLMVVDNVSKRFIHITRSEFWYEKF